jgi:uncharacterized protein
LHLAPESPFATHLYFTARRDLVIGLIPSPARARIPHQGVSWDYTTWLNIVFLALAAALIIRFVRTGGVAMLRMMGGPPDAHEHDHSDSHASHGD